jgi:hypothetical protein
MRTQNNTKIVARFLIASLTTVRTVTFINHAVWHESRTGSWLIMYSGGLLGVSTHNAIHYCFLISSHILKAIKLIFIYFKVSIRGVKILTHLNMFVHVSYIMPELLLCWTLSASEVGL